MPDNAIIQENAKTEGRMPQSYWDVAHSSQIEGFATDISTDAGGQVDFKINVNGDAGSDYTVEIFRLGYYGGDGARKVAEWTNTDATVQPDAQYDASRGLVDAGNWSVTDSWTMPADAVSGVYIARIQRLDVNGDPIGEAVNQIPFIVRDDDRPADIVLQTSDTSWQAYNGWFGNNGQIGANFYGDTSGTVDHPDIPEASVNAPDRAYAVSYNRPLITRGIEGQQGGPAAGAQDYLFGADYAAIYWLEQNGYDVSYISGVDTDRLGADYLTQYKSFISVGHDEYWSGDQRANVEDARDAGVNLMFWGGNDIYWKTRWETSIVDGEEFRTLVCYKETWANADPNATGDDYVNLDPTDIWTGTWRDVRFQDNPLAGGTVEGDLLSGQPHTCNCAENALTGQLFGPDGTGEFGGALDVPAEFSTLRVWRDTTIADGGALDIAEGILGYEWNTSPDDVNRPAGLIKLSETTIPWSGILVDQGNTVEAGEATHNLSIYRAESGALVFGAGTVFWSWALSDKHDSEPYGGNIANTDLQQFTVNLFADMGIQPGVADAVLASQGLVRASATNDFVAATATVDTPTESIAALETFTITGTATDDDGDALTDDGVVASVELSFDGGANWRVASGTSNWSFNWFPMVKGTYEVLVRAVDDSLNMPVITSLPSLTIDVTAPNIPEVVNLLSPFETFNGTLSNDNTAVELGTQFTTTVAGEITELRYYRHKADSADTDIRDGHLWTDTGELLATATFTSAPGEFGWQVAILDAPIILDAGAEYTVSYSTLDNYVATKSFFTGGYEEPYGIIAAPDSQSGVYAYGPNPTFPQSSFNGTNYWVDVSFSRLDVGNAAPTITSDDAFVAAENSTAVATITASDANDDAVTFAIAGGDDGHLFAIDSQTGALRFLFTPDFENPFDLNGDNQYDILVSASDNISLPVEQAVSILVTDIADEADPVTTTLFGPDQNGQSAATNDPTVYELGLRFVAQSDGTVSSLRYYRSSADASDTDVRTLNLWTAAGVNLGAVTVQSDAGQTGWQDGVLSTGIALEAGETYVVSYGTEQNYVFTSNFFATPWQNADGDLVAPAGANGVYAAGGTGLFPTQSFNSTNYWVDLTFTADPIGSNDAPVFTSSATLEAAENQTVAGTVAASDANGDNLTYAVVGGADGAHFAINAATGLLTFVTAPDYENPTDAGADNIYDVTVSVSDGTAAPVEQAISVTLTDDTNEPGPDTSRLFAATQTPAQTATNDPADYELGVRFNAASDGSITQLLYYRGVEDADDTDTRALNLWTDAGVKLATVTVVSSVGQSGWQVGTLSTPIDVQAGMNYIASYGTEQNYVYTSNFFDTAHTSDDFVLSAPASNSGAGNGVYAATGPDTFPNQTFNNTNYWVDVVFEPVDELLMPADSGAATFEFA